MAAGSFERRTSSIVLHYLTAELRRSTVPVPISPTNQLGTNRDKFVNNKRPLDTCIVSYGPLDISYRRQN